jgi:hypothetical protein
MGKAIRKGRVGYLLLVMATILIASCDWSAPAAPPAQTSPNATEQACALPSGKATATVDNKFNALFASQPDGWMGADGAYSVPLPDGRSAWLFGDTILGKPQADSALKPSAFINNSLIVQAGDRLTALHGSNNAKPAAMITPADSNTWYWPAGGVAEGNQLRVFLLHLKRAGSGVPGFDFTGIGHAIATLSLPELKVEGVMSMPFESEVDYGASFVNEGDYTYIYGLEDLGSVKFGHVARVPNGQIISNKWEFYDGAGWSSNPLSATRIISDVSNLSVFKQGDVYVLVGMETGLGFGKNILAYFACSPIGPWTGRSVIYTVPEASGSIITYLAIAHPEFSANGAMLISYCLNDTKPQNGIANTSVYRPHFIRVNFAAAP